MKTKIMKTWLLGLCLFLPLSHQGQISPKTIKGFPAHVLFKIDQVTSRIKLSEEKQIKLAKKIVSMDSLATLGFTKGETVAELKKKYFNLDRKALKDLLSAEEADEYFYQIDEKNRFLVALHQAARLKLEPTQVIQIRKENAVLDSLNLVDEVPRNAYCNQKLEPILDKKQYASLIFFLYAKTSLEETNKVWKKIQALQLIAPKDTAAVFKELLGFNLHKNRILDTEAQKYDTKKTDELRNLITYEKRPAVMFRYQILSDESYRANLFSTSIKYEKELSLSQTQIDTLLSKYKKLELTKLRDIYKKQAFNKANEYALFENSNIVKILDPQQIVQLLICKNKRNAGEMAIYSWGELEKKGLVKDLDKNATLKDFANYQLRYLVAVEQLRMNNNQINLFRKRDVELKKPLLLKQLDELKNVENNQRSTKNELKW
ncbi:hypothetical protein [Flavobacterium sp. FlaQc-48]|uniref:hypothetical protein n=1 Tax=Flavobacterium sp. FlaQc-48 TaxID=3374181 RepID=UPI0037582D2F